MYSATNSTRGAVVVSAGIEPAAAIGGGFRRALCQLSYDTMDLLPRGADRVVRPYKGEFRPELHRGCREGGMPDHEPAQPFLRKGL